MKKDDNGPRPPEDEMRPEYDFSGGVRGKYAERYLRSNARVLPEDLSLKFPDSESVERALRKLLKYEGELGA